MANKKMTVNGKNENNNAKINLISKCISCSHKEVCKYKEEFEKLMEEIKNKGIKIPKMFNLDITCSKYSSHSVIRIIDTTPQITPLYTPGITPAPGYIQTPIPNITTPSITPGITPSITTPNFDDGNFPKVTCELTDGSIGTATTTTDGISGKGTITLRG